MVLAERNITILTMGGGEFADRYAPTRSDLLADISQSAPVPHLFVLDRDQRTMEDVSRIEQRLEGCVHVLQARELENYLLKPRALREAIKQKCSSNQPMLEKLDETTDKKIEELIRHSASQLYGMVLVKRIRSELGGLKEKLLPRDTIEALATQTHRKSLWESVYKAVRNHLKPHLSKESIKNLVLEQKEILDSDWSNEDQILAIAPGEAILDAVFSKFEVQYNKSKDVERIAKQMSEEEIDDEIKQLLRRTSELATHP